MNFFPKSGLNAKVVLIGESSVGKTSIMNVLHGDFNVNQNPTVDACMYVHSVYLDNGLIKMYIWDTAGQERFQSLAPIYYRDAQYAIIVYSITSRTSFDKIKQWFECLKNNCHPIPYVILVGNKSDLEESRLVSTEEGKIAADEICAIDYFEISARESPQSAKSIFDKIARNILINSVKSTQQVTSAAPKIEKNSCC